MELPSASVADSDMESGSLVIDEGEKKKSLKRKALTPASNTPVSQISCYFIKTDILEYPIHTVQYCAREQLLINILQEKLRNCRQIFLKIK